MQRLLQVSDSKATKEGHPQSNKERTKQANADRTVGAEALPNKSEVVDSMVRPCEL